LEDVDLVAGHQPGVAGDRAASRAARQLLPQFRFKTHHYGLYLEWSFAALSIEVSKISVFQGFALFNRFHD